MEKILLTGVFVVGFVLIHVFGGHLRFLDVIPRSRFLSAAGGAAVAYVFLHIFPMLAEGQRRIETSGWLYVEYLENHVYIIALVGLIVFYGLERAIRSVHHPEHRESLLSYDGVFWLHFSSFAFYNLFVGYLLVNPMEPQYENMWLFFLAMSFHFLSNDYGLRKDHQHDYDHYGRWILAGSVVLGWVLGLIVHVSERLLTIMFAMLAGGVILNVLKEELPGERRARFTSFLFGAVVYATLLILAIKKNIESGV